MKKLNKHSFITFRGYTNISNTKKVNSFDGIIISIPNNENSSTATEFNLTLINTELEVRHTVDNAYEKYEDLSTDTMPFNIAEIVTVGATNVTRIILALKEETPMNAILEYFKESVQTYISVNNALEIGE